MQAMYTRISFRGAKTGKIGGKKYVLGQIDKFWGRHDTQIKKNACKNAYLGLFSYLKSMCLGCVLKVVLQEWYPAWNTSGPPGSARPLSSPIFETFLNFFHNFISVPLSKNPLWSSQLVCPIPSSANNFPFRPCRTLEASFLEDLVPPRTSLVPTDISQQREALHRG